MTSPGLGSRPLIGLRSPLRQSFACTEHRGLSVFPKSCDFPGQSDTVSRQP